MNPLRFPTVAANWEHFAKVDIAPNAPPEQRSEMERAFMAGLSSGLLLSMAAYDNDEPAPELAKLNAELMAWSALRKMAVKA